MDALREYNEKIKPFTDIKGCAFKSYNWYKGGADELVYEAGLCWELKQLGYQVLRQQDFPIFYKGEQTNILRRIDVAVETFTLGNIILELKSVNYIEDKHRQQLHSYLRLTNTRYGMLLNFGPKMVYTEIWEYNPTDNSCYRIKV